MRKLKSYICPHCRQEISPDELGRIYETNDEIRERKQNEDKRDYWPHA